MPFLARTIRTQDGQTKPRMNEAPGIRGLYSLLGVDGATHYWG